MGENSSEAATSWICSLALDDDQHIYVVVHFVTIAIPRWEDGSHDQVSSGAELSVIGSLSKFTGLPETPLLRRCKSSHRSFIDSMDT